MNKNIYFLLFLVFLVGCTNAEFSCEDNGGIWQNDACNMATSDSSYICTDNNECDGYCYTTKHPKAISDDLSNGFPLSGSCSSHITPLGCAKTIENQQIVELCR